MSLSLPFPGPLSIAIYLTIWWVVFLAVLPFGVRSQHEQGKVAQGTDPGAPQKPRIFLKILWTSAISALLFFVFCAYVTYTLEG